MDSFHAQDFDMERKIELEIRLRELAAQSMLEAQNEIDVLEVEKSLLTSDQRMNCYANQLEEQRRKLASKASSPLSANNSLASSSSPTGKSHSTDSGRSSGIAAARRRISRGLNNSRSSQVNNGNRNNNGTPSGDDVITLVENSTSSPSFCGDSVSTSSPMSKLSPVSGESSNEGQQQQQQLSDREAAKQVPARHSTSINNNNNTLRAKQRAKNRQREQLMQTITSLSNINCNMVTDNRASITISELRSPLMWRDVDHFKGRGDYKRFAVFCLLRINSQIYDTQLICDVDREVTDVTFEDVVVFNEIDHNFELILEVYSCVYLEQFSLSSAPRKLKEKFSNSVSKAMGRRFSTQTASAQFTKELQAYDKSHRFAMIASATLRLNDASDSVKTYDLVLVTPSAHHRNHQGNNSNLLNGSLSKHSTNNSSGLFNRSLSSGNHLDSSSLAHSFGGVNTNTKDAHKNTLPLFGHFCCRLGVRPDVFDKNVKSGYLKVATISIPNGTHADSRQLSADTKDKSKLVDEEGRQNSNNSPSSQGYESNDSSSAATSATNQSSPSLASSRARRCSSGASSGKDKDQNGHSENATKITTSNLMVATNKMATLSMSSATIYWGLLRNFTLYLWQVDAIRLHSFIMAGKQLSQVLGSANLGQPKLTLPIDKYARLLRVSNSSLTIETNAGECFIIGAYCPEDGVLDQDDEITEWLRTVEQHIYDSHIWGSVLNHYPRKQASKLVPRR